jgi:2-dehydro-3-deoxygluconokinase
MPAMSDTAAASPAITAPAIIALGEPLFEFNRRKDGEGLWLEGHGGDTSNAAIAAARQGARTAYISALGDDIFGQSLLELWRREEVDSSRVKIDAEAPTGLYFVTHGKQGHEFAYRRAGSAASRMGPADLPETVLGPAAFLHVSGISQAVMGPAVDHALALARRQHVAISYDTNLRLKLWSLDRARAAIHAGVAQADIVFTSIEEAETLTGRNDPTLIADFYLGLGPRIILVKLGAQGVFVVADNQARRIGGHKVNAVDATGAGDVFAGAFLAERAAGRDAFAAAIYANAAAALSTTGYGAVAPIPRREVVEKLLINSR